MDIDGNENLNFHDGDYDLETGRDRGTKRRRVDLQREGANISMGMASRTSVIRHRTTMNDTSTFSVASTTMATMAMEGFTSARSHWEIIQVLDKI